MQSNGNQKPGSAARSLCWADRENAAEDYWFTTYSIIPPPLLPSARTPSAAPLSLSLGTLYRWLDRGPGNQRRHRGARLRRRYHSLVRRSSFKTYSIFPLSLSLSLSWNDSTGRFLVGSLKDIASILLYPIRNDNRIPLDVNEEAKFVPFRSNKSWDYSMQSFAFLLPYILYYCLDR